MTQATETLQTVGETNKFDSAHHRFWTKADVDKVSRMPIAYTGAGWYAADVRGVLRAAAPPTYSVKMA